jgi:hypothetical protein
MEMSDLVNWLRDTDTLLREHAGDSKTGTGLAQAADRIEAPEAENERLLNVLWKMANCNVTPNNGGSAANRMRDDARAAVEH